MRLASQRTKESWTAYKLRSTGIVLGERTLLGQAFLLSIALHILVFATAELGVQLGWWAHWHRTLIRRFAQQTQILRRPSPPRPLPVIFVDVSPAQAESPPEKPTPYYGVVNTRAGNPHPGHAKTPRFEGSQTKVLKTTDSPPRPQLTVEKAQPLRPRPASPPSGQDRQKEKPDLPATASSPQPSPVPKAQPSKMIGPHLPSQQKGELMIASAKPIPMELSQTSRSTALPRKRPLTLAEALARRRLGGKPTSQIVGRQYKQEGGVKRFSVQPSFDVEASPLGDYDARLVAAVQECWYSLLRAQRYSLDRVGKVVIEFRLTQDGRVTNLHVVESNVGEVYTTLCVLAIKRPAPYDPWPAELRRLIGRNYRLVRFTFYY